MSYQDEENQQCMVFKKFYYITAR